MPKTSVIRLTQSTETTCPVVANQPRAPGSPPTAWPVLPFSLIPAPCLALDLLCRRQNLLWQTSNSLFFCPQQQPPPKKKTRTCLSQAPQLRRLRLSTKKVSWSHATGPGDGGGLGGDSSWGAGYGGDVGRVDRPTSPGSRAAGREARTPRLAGACERQARVFGGALRCLALVWPVVKSPPKTGY
jgi:hypothetical protein